MTTKKYISERIRKQSSRKTIQRLRRNHLQNNPPQRNNQPTIRPRLPPRRKSP